MLFDDHFLVVVQGDLAFGVALGQRVLEPLLVVALGIILTGMASAANNQTTTSLSMVTSLEVNGKKL